MKKIALVTGSSRGIGRSIAMTLAEEGYEVIVHYKENEAKANEVKEAIEKNGGVAYVFQADVSKDSELEKLFSMIETKFQRLDLLVSNVGFDYGKLIEDYSMEEMRYVVDVVLMSKIVATKLALPLLKKADKPNIINIASRTGKEKTIETIGAYGPAEAGVVKWTECCALEFAEYGIRVNCVAPGLTVTDLTKSILSDEEFAEAGKANPRGRVALPQDIANVVAFLASSKSDYINGETIGVNGGSNLG